MGLTIKRRRAVGFDLIDIGDVPFLRNVTVRFAERFPSDLIWMFHHESTVAEFEKLIPGLNGRVHHMPYSRLPERRFRKLDLYVTTQQYVPGPIGVYALTLSHGQPSKGVTFLFPGPSWPTPENVLGVNDAVFLYGPLHRQALEEHLAIRGLSMPPHLSLFNIGYTKSDDLIQGRFDRKNFLERLGLDPGKKTILYAPAFNEGASMREFGVEILRILSAMNDYNVLAKLAAACLRPTSDLAMTGGVDWFKTIGELERNYPNFRLVRDLEADPAMASSDVMITCISSIGFEFLALGKPVIYIETPRYFAEILSRVFPEIDTSSWASRTAVNGGREFGLLVSRPDELPQAVAEVLGHPETYPRNKAGLLDYLLYNPGKATEAAVEQMDRLLRQRVRSQRSPEKARVSLHFMSGYSPPRTKIKRALRSFVFSKPKAVANSVLNPFGYTITKGGDD